MSDLAAFRDHARAMSTTQHKPECPPRDRVKRWVNAWDHEHDEWGGHFKPSKCSGCRQQVKG